MKSKKILKTFFSIYTIIGLVAATTAGQKTVLVSPERPSAVPTPIRMGGGPTCATLNASSDPAFSQISEDWGLRVNRAGDPPYDAVFTFTNGPETELIGGAGPSPGSAIRVAADGTTVNWVSNRTITAVIVISGAPESNVYSYNPASLGGFPNGDGTALDTGNPFYPMYHLIFCFESISPSAAPASVSGRVLDSFGYGIGGVSVQMSNIQDGTIWTAITSPFGYYVIEGPEVGNFYMLTVSHKRYSFADGVRTFTLNEDLVGVDFIASP